MTWLGRRQNHCSKSPRKQDFASVYAQAQASIALTWQFLALWKHVVLRKTSVHCWRRVAGGKAGELTQEVALLFSLPAMSSVLRPLDKTNSVHYCIPGHRQEV